MKTSLVVMAAGIGSRFGVGIKQLEPVGLHDEIIMDYSIHDAIRAGFDKIIIVIRKDIEADFRERIGNRVEEICRKTNVELHYAFQDMQAIPKGNSVPEGRVKPWGTGQAVLTAKPFIQEPFMVVNADDYYGASIFTDFHEYLSQPHKDYCMAGYQIMNTLSDHGSVTRGVCKAEGGLLTGIEETKNVMKTEYGPESAGRKIPADSIVSMNMWGFPAEHEGESPAYLTILEEDFVRFFREDVPQNPLTAEYLLPIHIGNLLKEGRAQVRILKTQDKWIGVTYKEDMPIAKESFRALIQSGTYRENLYEDLQ